MPSLVYVCMIARLVGPSQFSCARNERIGRLEMLLSLRYLCCKKIGLSTQPDECVLKWPCRWCLEGSRCLFWVLGRS